MGALMLAGVDTRASNREEEWSFPRGHGRMASERFSLVLNLVVSQEGADRRLAAGLVFLPMDTLGTPGLPTLDPPPRCPRALSSGTLRRASYKYCIPPHGLVPKCQLLVDADLVWNTIIHSSWC